MPTIENRLPAMDRRSLSRRIERAARARHNLSGTWPAESAIRTRREQKRLERLFDELVLAGGEPNVDAIVALHRSLVASRDQMLDILALPRRPVAKLSKERAAIPISASPEVVDVVDASDDGPK